jgi:hypothetical protein
MSAFPSILMTSAGNSAPLIIDLTALPSVFLPSANYTLGLIATVSSGASLTYTVQVTADQKPTSTGNWNSHDVLVNQTGSANSNIAYPVTGIRLNVTNYVSGSVNLGVAKWP